MCKWILLKNICIAQTIAERNMILDVQRIAQFLSISDETLKLGSLNVYTEVVKDPSSPFLGFI